MGTHNKIFFSILLLLVVIFIQFVTPQSARAACAPDQIIYVAPSGDNTTGCSWTTAFTTLQSALATATSGDQIWVASGTYSPGALRTDTFQLKNGVKVYGGFTGTENLLTQRNPTANVTILSGVIGNNFHVVTSSGTDNSAVLDGFTITGGNANVSPDNNGGGILNDNGSPTLSNLIIRANNASTLGGGVYSANNSNPILTRVVFDSNTALRGAGMFNILNSNATLTDVTFSNNVASTRGGGISISGGNLNLTNVTFDRNRAQFGGGIQNIFGSNSILTNVTFNGNIASNQGGAVYIVDANPILRNVTISGNTAPVGDGGGVYSEASSPSYTTTITNSIIYGNTGGGNNRI